MTVGSQWSNMKYNGDVLTRDRRRSQ